MAYGGTPGRLKTATPRCDRQGALIQAETSSSSFGRPAHLKGDIDHRSSIPTVDGATMSLTSRSLRLTASTRPPSPVLLRTRLVLPGSPTSSGSLKERRGVPRAGQTAFSHCGRLGLARCELNGVHHSGNGLRGQMRRSWCLWSPPDQGGMPRDSTKSFERSSASRRRNGTSCNAWSNAALRLVSASLRHMPRCARHVVYQFRVTRH